MADWTVIKLIQTTAELLAARGIEAPKVDAEHLLGHVLGQNRTWLYMNANRPVDDAERERFRDLVSRRAHGEPIAYILGTVGFWEIELAIDERALVPRPETEFVVEHALAFCNRFDHEAWRMVDVGTGSGAIALALAHALPKSTVLAIDLSPDALELARTNADTLELRDRVSFVHGDLLAPLKGREAVVDVIVSNPPYIGDDDPELQAAVREHEPSMALFSGKDGLDALRKLIPDAARALKPGGVFIAEFGARQGAAVRALAAPHFEVVEIHQDYAKLDRILVAVKAGTLDAPLKPSAAPAEDADELAEGDPTDAQTEASDAFVGDGDDADDLDIKQRLLREANEVGLPVIEIEDL